jgi:hypothetical protein
MDKVGPEKPIAHHARGAAAGDLVERRHREFDDLPFEDGRVDGYPPAVGLPRELAPPSALDAARDDPGRIELRGISFGTGMR